MGVVYCCEHNRRASSYNVIPREGFISVIMHVMDKECPECGKFIVELERIDAKGNKSTIRKIDAEAYKLFDKNENGIISNVTSTNIIAGRFYLNCSEYGKVTRCYSNLSTMKLGITDVSEGSEEYQKREKYIDLKDYAVQLVS